MELLNKRRNKLIEKPNDIEFIKLEKKIDEISELFTEKNEIKRKEIFSMLNERIHERGWRYAREKLKLFDFDKKRVELIKEYNLTPIKIDIKEERIPNKPNIIFFNDKEQHYPVAFRFNSVSHNAAFKEYEGMNKKFEEEGRKIYNATEGGKLETLERVNLEDIL